MKRIDELIKKEIRLEKKRDALQEELEKAEKDLTAVHKLRVDAEKIMSRMEAEQKKLDDLLKDQIPPRGRKKIISESDDSDNSESNGFAATEPISGDSYEERG